MGEPLHRSILLADIENSGMSDDVVRRERRRHMYQAVRFALEAAEVGRADHLMEDRGDGVMVLVSPVVSKTRLLRSVLAEIPDRLHVYNRVADESARVRLRVVLAAGEVALDEAPDVLGGALGWDLDQAFRLLNGDPLREALRQGRLDGHTARDAVICVSEAVYQGVVRHDYPGIRRDAFHAITVAAKEGPVRGWVHGDVVPRQREQRQTASPLRAPAPPGAVGEREREGEDGRADQGTEAGPAAPAPPPAGGTFVAGDAHGVSGGHVEGDVVMGSKIVGGPWGGERR